MSAAQKSSPQRRDQVKEFKNWLATLSKSDLDAVLSHRRDTAIPIPPDINALATRMLLPGSIALALSRCTAAELAIIEALSRTGAELQPVAVADIAPLLPLAPQPALASLRSKALSFNAGAPDSYSLLPRVMQALPTDLSLLEQPEFSADEVRGLSAEKRQVLATIARAGGSMVTVGAHSKLAASQDLNDLIAQGIVTARSEERRVSEELQL